MVKDKHGIKKGKERSPSFISKKTKLIFKTQSRDGRHLWRSSKSTEVQRERERERNNKKKGTKIAKSKAKINNPTTNGVSE